MDPMKEYGRWMEADIDLGLREELEEIQGNPEEIRDRFWRELEFGTGGLRGIIGAGSNRMNRYTVGKATQGLADYLKENFEEPSVCIAYDTRNMSREFAVSAAQVFRANGIKAYLFEDVRPTPMLSWAVRLQKAAGGIVITASHNPKEYNGYKVYGPDGCQITDEAAAAILEKINSVDVFRDVKASALDDSGLLSLMGESVDAPYYEKVKALSMRGELLAQKAGELKILYSPLNGSGNKPVRRVLEELGFTQLSVVPEQERPDGDFPTTPYPNPEEPEVYRLAIALASQSNPDLIFATDPDCDRIGVLVKDDAGEYSVLTGNQVGALLCDYIITTKKEQGSLPANAAVIKTIVTTDMAKAISEKHGVAVVDTLTGFKYIGEQVGRWEQDGKQSFLLGFEESYGYLAGDFVRDKDAVIAAALIAEMALYYKSTGKTLYQAMDALYDQYGWYREKLISITKPGQQGQQQIADILSGLRRDYNGLLGGNIAYFEDYSESVRLNVSSGEKEAIPLPKSNVLKFIFDDGSWLVVRPSGTEPKMKLYLAATADSGDGAAARLAELETIAAKIVD